MLLYCKEITPRAGYICDFIGRELSGEPMRLTTHAGDLFDYPGVKICYADTRVTDDCIWIQPAGLLSASGIEKTETGCFDWNNNKAFFSTTGDLPFDILAASFYLLSRYEEYLPHKKDMYGRYAHENSLAWREGFLQVPLINIWLREFSQIIKNRFPSFSGRRSSFVFLPTYDIDEAYSFKYKTWQRSAGGAVRDLLSGKFKRFAQRRRVIDNKETDPYDAYAWMDDLHRPHKLQPHYFFLAAEKNGKLDKNNLPSEIPIQTLIRNISGKYATGVHPSWQSGDDHSLIRREKQRIEDIAKIKVTASRQHFIRFTLPLTYRLLMEAGITDDFSMGYGSINGFRASVASSFYWYDLERETATSLLLHPFCYMEANSFYEQRQTPDKSLQEMRHYYEVVRAVNGTLITIWHNTFLGTDERLKGWREAYSTFFNEVAGD